MTYALLVPQSPYKIAAARGTFTLRGRLTLVAINCFDSEPRRRRAATWPTSARAGIGPEPCTYNDADEVSCRARAIKCSRCRASFAPIESGSRRTGSWVPRWTCTRGSIKQNKELRVPSDPEYRSQVNESAIYAIGVRSLLCSRLVRCAGGRGHAGIHARLAVARARTERL